MCSKAYAVDLLYVGKGLDNWLNAYGYYFSIQVLHLDNVGHLFKKCDTANLRINAQKRKAIVWYNHFVNEETGWMGDIDEYTFHGGCPVLEGEKWIANFWIKTDADKDKDVKKMKKVMNVTNKYKK